MEVFVARQPIFDVRMNLLGYELLFRSGIDNFFDSKIDGDYATKKVVANSFLVIGLDKVTKGKRAFVNFTRKHLLSAAPLSIPGSKLGIEILESVEPDDEVVDACRGLKQSGYLIVLDDFVFHEKYEHILKLADIIKIDFSLTNSDDRRLIFSRVNNKDVKFLAEKVETNEQFQEALDLGYTYFQGYFFSKPTIVSGRDIPANKLNYIRIIQEVNNPDADFEKIEKVVKRDVSLSYKLLRFINSVFFSHSVKVESIKHALVLLGIGEVKKWINILALTAIGFDKTEELITVALIRAKFCEFIAPRIGQESRESDFFMMGLFSVLDALIDRPLEEILSELPISEDITCALTGEQNTFHEVYNLALFYEKGNWEKTTECAQGLNIEEKDLPGFFYRSIEWAHEAIYA